MILRDATILYKGYDPEDLKPKSNKRICCSCDNLDCKNPIRWIRLSHYRDFCKKCSEQLPERCKKISENTNNKGKNNPMYGRTGELAPFHGIGKLNPMWKGGIAGNRNHVLSENQCIK